MPVAPSLSDSAARYRNGRYNRRVIGTREVFAKSSFEILLSKVESIGVEQGMYDRLVGRGTVLVRGTGGSTERFTKIANPLDLRRSVQYQMERPIKEGEAN
jgi:hypothetical protein